MNMATRYRARWAWAGSAKAKRRWWCVAAMSFMALASSCRDDCEVGVARAGVRFDDLDEASKARLRAEAEVEVRAKIEAQVRTECESKYRAALLAAQSEGGVVGVEGIHGIGGEGAVGKEGVEGADLDAGMIEGERDAEGLRIMRLLLATDVVRRLPVDARDVFTLEDGSIFCYVEISAPKEEPRAITLRFTHATGLTQSYELPINQSPAWRTWSKLNLTRSMTGRWSCEIFNEDGVRLAHRAFEVVNGEN